MMTMTLQIGRWHIGRPATYRRQAVDVQLRRPTQEEEGDMTSILAQELQCPKSKCRNNVKCELEAEEEAPRWRRTCLPGSTAATPSHEVQWQV